MVILPGLTLFETISQFTSEGMRYRDTHRKREGGGGGRGGGEKEKNPL